MLTKLIIYKNYINPNKDTVNRIFSKALNQATHSLLSNISSRVKQPVWGRSLNYRWTERARAPWTVWQEDARQIYFKLRRDTTK